MGREATYCVCGGKALLLRAYDSAGSLCSIEGRTALDHPLAINAAAAAAASGLAADLGHLIPILIHIEGVY